MAARKITRVSSFLSALDGMSALHMFRGQARAWPLLPSIGRLTAEVQDYANWNIFQLDLLERFVKLASPMLLHQLKNSVEWLVHAQHHGVPTRLLDWSTNPLKALFWAVERGPNDHHDGVVWGFDPRHWREDVLKPTELADDKLTAFFPMHINQRVVAQEACFVSFPLALDTRPMRPMDASGAYEGSVGDLEQLVIPAKSKADIRLELQGIGISYRFLFPDLEGVARQINEDVRKT